MLLPYSLRSGYIYYQKYLAQEITRLSTLKLCGEDFRTLIDNMSKNLVFKVLLLQINNIKIKLIIYLTLLNREYYLKLKKLKMRLGK